MNARVSWALETGALFLAYFLSAELGLALLFDPKGGLVTLVWPPTGLALAALVIRGQRLWPAVALGALAINLFHGAPRGAACGMAFGNTVEAMLGAFLLRKVGFRAAFDRIRDVIALVSLAGVASTAVSATIGVASLWLSGKTPSSQVVSTWQAWWLGDAIADLVVAPVVLVLGSRPQVDRRPWRLAEATLLTTCLAAVSFVVLAHVQGEPSRSFPYLIFPFLMWASLRFGQTGGTSATLFVAVIAVWATVRGIGPFTATSTSEGLLNTQIFMTVVALTVLLLSAALAERKRAVLDRERANEELGARNAELTRSNHELEDFATIASHDLQEPLRKVHLFVDRLARRLGGSLDSEAEGLLDRVMKASERVQKLIDDLFAFARVKTRVDPFERVDLVEVARGTVSDLEARIAQVNGRVAIGPLPTIEADPVQMRQLVQNLVGNALKFNRKGVAPIVTIRSEPAGAGSVRLLVEDNGIGFDEKYLDRIFTIFHRLHGREEYEGTGVGLAICRRIVERHGGSITARSKIEQGSTFVVTLPVAQPEGPPA